MSIVPSTCLSNGFLNRLIDASSYDGKKEIYCRLPGKELNTLTRHHNDDQRLENKPEWCRWLAQTSQVRVFADLQAKTFQESRRSENGLEQKSVSLAASITCTIVRSMAIPCLTVFPIRLNIKESGEKEKTDWIQMKDKWAPQEKDPPHVNFMKKAEITNADGIYLTDSICIKRTTDTHKCKWSYFLVV